MKLIATGLIEYKGDFYTPEEFAELMKDKGTYDVGTGETWFSKRMEEAEQLELFDGEPQ